MENIVKIEKGIFASLITVLSFVYNSLGVLFIVLIALMCIDYVTGLSSAWVRGEQKSRTGIIGIMKKIGYILLVITALLFDMAIIHVAAQLGTTLPVNSIFGVIVTCWLISNESLSIMENLTKIGVPTPDFLTAALKKFREHVETIAQSKQPK